MKSNYESAIPLYLDYLDKKTDDEALTRLATSYRKIGHWLEAEYWYAQVVFLPSSEHINMLYYGKALQANGKCEFAIEWFNEYSKAVPNDYRGYLLARACTKDAIHPRLFCDDCYSIESLSFNSKYEDSSPVFYQNNLLYISSKKLSSQELTNTSSFLYTKLFALQIDTLDWMNQEYLYQELDEFFFQNDTFSIKTAIFSEDGNAMYFTANKILKPIPTPFWESLDDYYTKLKIFIAEKKDNHWQVVSEFPWNNDDYNIAHPTLSADGQRLYFASDMPGGFGRMDLYYSDKKNGEWTEPVNLGKPINTENHDLFPMLHHATNKLYFSSKGLFPSHGLDIQYVNLDDTLKEVYYLNAPMNSNKDDFGLILNEAGTFGYFTSNRNGGMGQEDIYAVKLNVVNLKVIVTDVATKEVLEDVQLKSKYHLGTFITRKDGKTSFEMKTNDCKTFKIEKAGYKTIEKEICTKDATPNSTIFIEIQLEKGE